MVFPLIILVWFFFIFILFLLFFFLNGYLVQIRVSNIDLNNHIAKSKSIILKKKKSYTKESWKKIVKSKQSCIKYISHVIDGFFFCIFHYGSVDFFCFWNCSIHCKCFIALLYFWNDSKLISKQNYMTSQLILFFIIIISFS